MNRENLIEDSKVPPKVPIFLNRSTNSSHSAEISGINASIASSNIRLETTEEESVRLSRAVSVQQHTPFKSAVPDNSAVPKVYQYTATSKYCSPYKVNTGTDRFDQIHKFKNIVTRWNIFKQIKPELFQLRFLVRKCNIRFIFCDGHGSLRTAAKCFMTARFSVRLTT